MATSTSNEFTVTKNLFTAYANYTHPLSYDQWLATADDCKVAVLYCQFFEQITLAWHKLKSVYSLESDGVSEVLMYLTKNVPIIENDPARFTPAYIYRISYNCLYCLCRDPNLKKKAYENECSNLVSYGEDTVDLFDTVKDNSDSNIYDEDTQRSRFWEIVESKGHDAVVVVAELLGDKIDWTDENPDILDSKDVEELCWKHHKTTMVESDYRLMLKAKNAAKYFIHTIDQLEDGRFRVEYDAFEKKAHKGYRKVSKQELAKITPERKLEILEELRDGLEEFIDVFM